MTLKIFFLENHTQNVMKKLFPDPFLNNQFWAYPWIKSLKFYTVSFYCIPSWGLSKYIETKLKTTCFYIIQNFFKETRRGLELVSLFHIQYDFWTKIFLLLYSITWQNLIIWLPLLCETLAISVSWLFANQIVTS